LIKDGLAVDVVVDDYFPVDEYNRVHFMNNCGREIWPMVFEKAYAKLCGSYDRMDADETDF
jgi:hypothetical protein